MIGEEGAPIPQGLFILRGVKGSQNNSIGIFMSILNSKLPSVSA